MTRLFGKIIRGITESKSSVDSSIVSSSKQTDSGSSAEIPAMLILRDRSIGSDRVDFVSPFLPVPFSGEFSVVKFN